MRAVYVRKLPAAATAAYFTFEKFETAKQFSKHPQEN
jgi:hypothetical protein